MKEERQIVHTAMFMISLTENELTTISKNQRLEEIKNNIKINDGKAITLNVKKGPIVKNNQNGKSHDFAWRGFLIVDFIELLSKTDITEYDLGDALKKLEDYVCKFISSDSRLELIRIDYRFDSYVPDEKRRNLYFKLFKKCSDKVNYMHKRKYKTSLVYSSKSRRNNIYDKEVQLCNTNRDIQDYEKDIIRFEAQILPRHTYYQLKSNKVARTLANYFSESMYRKYMDKMILKVLFRGDYYNEYHVKKILNNSSVFTEHERKEALEFMILISKSRSVSKAIEIFGKYKANKYIKKLQEENINPILIPKYEKLTQIENPLKKLYDTWQN